MSRIKLGVLISGSGRTLQNFAELSTSGLLEAEIAVVVSSKEGVYGIERCSKLGLPCAVVPRRAFKDDDAFSAEVFAALRRHSVGLVAMAGFIHLLRIPEDFDNKVLNIHPALLPKYGGKGFYTNRVHEAVIKAGEKTSGCTVHIANNEYDRGPIVLQRTVPVLPADTPHDLADRVFAEECRAYPEAINLFAQGRIKVVGGKVEIVGV